MAMVALVLMTAASCKSERQRSSTPKKPAVKKAADPWATIDQTKRPVIIDSHVHLTPLPETINLALQVFSQVNVSKFVVKSAGSPGTMRYRATLKFADLLGDRMAYFTNVDWDDIDDPNWGQREADKLALAVKQGASGIKIFKALGLGVRLKDGKLLRIDDKRLEPIWRKAGEVGAIVAWHVADPVAFFKPINKKNERYEELSLAPEWSFHGQDYPSHAELLAQRDAVVKAHPKTTFLGIHLGNNPEDLDYVSKLLDQHPNMYVDVSARLGEIGRHPVAKVRALFSRHQDRILFGTDFIATPNGMQLGSTSATEPTFVDALKFYADHRRYFETDQPKIDHPTPIQGRWKINAIKLPPKLLAKFYRDNAERLIFARRSKWLAAQQKKK
jgi:predicted TIM-barrel fold metal-dependent hydrolase